MASGLISNINTEMDFENYILEAMPALYSPKHDYRKREQINFDYETALDKEILFEFLNSEQSDTLNRLAKKRGQEVDSPEFVDYFAHSLQRQFAVNGKLKCLKSGVEIGGFDFTLVYEAAPNKAAEETIRKANSNIFTIMKEVDADKYGSQRIDLVGFINGIPIYATELKSIENGQTYQDAEDEWLTRDAKLPLFRDNEGVLIFFAVDQDRASYSLSIDDIKASFRPYNLGSGKGKDKTSANPPADGEYCRTHYMYDDVWSPDTLLLLIFSFCQQLPGYGRKHGDIIFPRYHQLEAVRSTVKDLEKRARRGEDTRDYLIEHFAGSGKTFEIAWIALLASKTLKDDGEAIIDKAFIISNRLVVKNQLADAMYANSTSEGIIEYIGDDIHQSRKKRKVSLDKAISGNARIVITTIQRFLRLAENDFGSKLEDNKRYLVLIDEGHSGYDGKDMDALRSVLSPVMGGNVDAVSVDDDDDVNELEKYVDAAIENQIANSGRRSNISFCVFTATPTQKTRQRFGNPHDYSSWSVYSMRQSIEEGYTLNPLDHIAIFSPDVQFKNEHEDILVSPNKAYTVAETLKKQSEETMRAMVANVCETFLDEVQGVCLPKNEAKGMAMLARRREAIKFYYMMKEYVAKLEEEGDPRVSGERMGIVPLVAFTSEVPASEVFADGDASEMMTEASINGFSDTKTKAKFASDDYNFLIVANKYQVGFDEQRLCAPYLCRHMEGVNGVQSICRSNRIYPGHDKKTYVAAFYNTYDEIVEMFEPFYDGGSAQVYTSALSEIRRVYNTLMAQGIVDKYFVDEFVGKYWRAKQDKDAGILDSDARREYNAVLSELTHRIDAMPLELRYEFRSTARSYANKYDFYKLNTKIEDHDLVAMRIIAEKIRHHIIKLPEKPADYEMDDIAERLEVSSLSYKNKEHIGENPFGDVEAVKAGTKQAPVGNDDEDKAETEEKSQAKKRLSEIITELNSLGVVEEKDELINTFDALVYDAMLDPEIKQSAVANDYPDFDSEFNRIVRQKLVKSATKIANKSLKRSIMALLKNTGGDNTYERVMAAFTKVKIRCWKQSREAGSVSA